MCLGSMEAFLVRSEHKAILKVRTKYKEKLRKIYHPNLVLEKSLLEDESSFLLQILLMIFNYLCLTSKATNFFQWMKRVNNQHKHFCAGMGRVCVFVSSF